MSTRDPEPSVYLDEKLADMRAAIGALNDDHIIGIINHIRADAGATTASRIVTHLLQAAHNPLTDPTEAACIETALARYQTQ